MLIWLENPLTHTLPILDHFHLIRLGRTFMYIYRLNGLHSVAFISPACCFWPGTMKIWSRRVLCIAVLLFVPLHKTTESNRFSKVNFSTVFVFFIFYYCCLFFFQSQYCVSFQRKIF